MPNDNTRVLVLQSGEADIIENPPGNLTSEIDKTPGLHVDLFPSTRVDFIQLDASTIRRSRSWPCARP